MMGTVTTRVLPVHSAKLGCPEGRGPTPFSWPRPESFMAGSSPERLGGSSGPHSSKWQCQDPNPRQVRSPTFHAIFGK